MQDKWDIIFGEVSFKKDYVAVWLAVWLALWSSDIHTAVTVDPVYWLGKRIVGVT